MEYTKTVKLVVDKLARALLAAVLIFAAPSCAIVTDKVVGVSAIEATELEELLAEDSEVLVIDIRDRESYRQGHIKGARSLLVDELHGFFANTHIPRNHEIVAVCYNGNQTREAVAIAQAAGFERTVHLRDGMTAWREQGLEVERGGGESVASSLLEPTVITPTLHEQSFLTLSACVIKPAYMLISLLIIIALWRKRERDLALLRWSMVAFLIGESLCAANYLVTGGESDSLELAHGFGMVVMGALLPWGFFALLDRRVLRLTPEDARCAVQRFCGRCWKRDAGSCGVHRLFQLLAPLLALVSLIPWSGPLRPRYLSMSVFGHEILYVRSLTQLLIEQRLYPTVAAIAFLVTAVMLSGGKRSLHRTELPFFIGMGFLSFALLRFFLSHSFPAMQGWTDVWEEATELFTICSLAVVLWLFRHQLSLVRRPRREATEGPT